MKVANRNIKSREEKAWKEERTRNDLVNRFMCGFTGGAEDLVHFR